jgi:hypothetical protein
MATVNTLMLSDVHALMTEMVWVEVEVLKWALLKKGRDNGNSLFAQ